MMDDLMFELELIKEAEEEQEKKEQAAREKSVSVSPYQSAHQEGMGQLASLFQDIDDVLMDVFSDEEDEFLLP